LQESKLKRWLIAVGVSITAVSGILIALGTSPSPEAICEQAFTSEYGPEFEGFVVKEKSWNRISFDLKGYYNNGEWSCALSNNPVEFRSGILFPRDSNSSSFSE
jgi:hypothetical protein